MAQTPEIQEVVNQVLALEAEDLSEWEAQFVSSIRRQMKAGKTVAELSPKQLEVIYKIHKIAC